MFKESLMTARELLDKLQNIPYFVRTNVSSFQVHSFNGEWVAWAMEGNRRLKVIDILNILYANKKAWDCRVNIKNLIFIDIDEHRLNEYTEEVVL